MGKDEKKQQLASARELTKIAWGEVIKEDEEEISDLIGRPWRLLFVAAKMGNVDFLITLILSYPDVLWKVDERERSIFHIAIKYRHEEIFKLIHEIGAIKDFLATYKDANGNNMLHLAAKIAPPDRLNCVSGAALQMQRELLWFEAVKDVVQAHYAVAKNHTAVAENYEEEAIQNVKDNEEDITQNDMERSESYKSAQESGEGNETVMSGQNDGYRSDSEDDEHESNLGKTPQALFTKQHENLRLQGEEWMKKTAESCTLVAALIATVDFTAAFTLPGGNDDKDGSPILLNQAFFKVFAMSNAVSLFASVTSILMFLSILTSRYAVKDFRKSLPTKLMVGLTSLFVSIATMMVAFTATLYITFQRNSILIPVPIAVLAALSVLLFVYLQYPLWKDIYYSTYKSWTLFKPSHKKTISWKYKTENKNELEVPCSSLGETAE